MVGVLSPQGWRRQADVLNSQSVGGGWLRAGLAANCREVTPSARGSANQSDNPNKQRKWCEREGRWKILFIRCHAQWVGDWVTGWSSLLARWSLEDL